MTARNEAEMAALRDRVMAALSEGNRRTAHPADWRLLRRQATCIALAIRADFAVYGRSAAVDDAPALGILLPKSHE